VILPLLSPNIKSKVFVNLAVLPKLTSSMKIRAVRAHVRSTIRLKRFGRDKYADSLVRVVNSCIGMAHVKQTAKNH